MSEKEVVKSGQDVRINLNSIFGLARQGKSMVCTLSIQDKDGHELQCKGNGAKSPKAEMCGACRASYPVGSEVDSLVKGAIKVAKTKKHELRLDDGIISRIAQGEHTGECCVKGCGSATFGEEYELCFPHYIIYQKALMPMIKKALEEKKNASFWKRATAMSAELVSASGININIAPASELVSEEVGCTPGLAAEALRHEIRAVVVRDIVAKNTSKSKLFFASPKAFAGLKYDGQPVTKGVVYRACKEVDQSRAEFRQEAYEALFDYVGKMPTVNVKTASSFRYQGNKYPRKVIEKACRVVFAERVAKRSFLEQEARRQADGIQPSQFTRAEFSFDFGGKTLTIGAGEMEALKLRIARKARDAFDKERYAEVLRKKTTAKPTVKASQPASPQKKQVTKEVIIPVSGDDVTLLGSKLQQAISACEKPGVVRRRQRIANKKQEKNK